MNLARVGVLLSLISMAAGCEAVKPLPIAVAPAAPGPHGHRLVTIPAGHYIVGAPGHANNPRRKVYLKQYRIADADTTNDQFKRFVEGTGYVTDAERRGYGKVAKEGMIDWAWNEVPGATWRQPLGPEGPTSDELPDHPVTQISGADAEAYCVWAGGRLPTLDEWEVAARAGALTRYPWGDQFDARRANVWNGATHAHNTLEDGWLYTSPVRTFPPNAWGLYDVIGNVFQYCSGLPGNHNDGDKQRFVAGRGGSWWCSAGTCNFFNLVDIGMMDRHGTLSNQGFRIAFGVEGQH
jgi:formylglycine-generating enzyme required for sulfatase activity